MATANFHFQRLSLSECFIELPVAIPTISYFAYPSWAMRGARNKAHKKTTPLTEADANNKDNFSLVRRHQRTGWQ